MNKTKRRDGNIACLGKNTGIIGGIFAHFPPPLFGDEFKHTSSILADQRQKSVEHCGGLCPCRVASGVHDVAADALHYAKLV